jgi:hypothetical protein
MNSPKGVISDVDFVLFAIDKNLPVGMPVIG